MCFIKIIAGGRPRHSQEERRACQLAGVFRSPQGKLTMLIKRKKIPIKEKKQNLQDALLISVQDSIGRRRDALWAIHPALVSLQEEEDLKNEKKMEEKGEDGEVKEDKEDKEEEKHLERVGEKVEEGPEEKEKREVCVNIDSSAEMLYELRKLPKFRGTSSIYIDMTKLCILR